ncbi:hypothetical protein ACINK0_04860 [Deinococcus sp. VB343]|uniref:hypothetical protein n=1 Tax=Deinococcus sp. VB343 TaxID=3385567 RepID=UPI0039C8E81B
MNERTFPTLANFLETWFCTSYDFDELGDVLARMRRLRAWENLAELRHEANALGDTPLATFNGFSHQHGGRGFTPARFAEFKRLLRAIEIEED